VNVFFDNCTSYVLASTLDGFIRNYGHTAIHIKDVQGLSKGRHSPDIEWLDFLRNSREKWLFFSSDKRILKNSAERAALKTAGLHGFILGPAASKTPLNHVAAILVWRWPEILKITELVAAPSMHEIPINKSTKLRSISF